MNRSNEYQPLLPSGLADQRNDSQKQTSEEQHEKNNRNFNRFISERARKRKENNNANKEFNQLAAERHGILNLSPVSNMNQVADLQAKSLGDELNNLQFIAEFNKLVFDTTQLANRVNYNHMYIIKYIEVIKKNYDKV